MKRHDFDPLSLLFGAAFIALSVLFAYGQFGVTGIQLRWLSAGFLLALGLAILATSGRRAREK